MSIYFVGCVHLLLFEPLWDIFKTQFLNFLVLKHLFLHIFTAHNRVTGGELFDRISDENFELTEEMAGKYVSQILEGVNYMHSLNVLHLDLKVGEVGWW